MTATAGLTGEASLIGTPVSGTVKILNAVLYIASEPARPPVPEPLLKIFARGFRFRARGRRRTAAARHRRPAFPDCRRQALTGTCGAAGDRGGGTDYLERLGMASVGESRPVAGG